MTQLERNEWMAWQEICMDLKTLGAITEDDLKARQDSLRTPGERLLSRIRHWGNLKVELEKGERQ